MSTTMPDTLEAPRPRRWMEWLGRFRVRLFGSSERPMPVGEEVMLATVMPILFLLLDPIIFKSLSGVEPGLLGHYAASSYLVIAIAMGSYGLWFWKREGLGVWCAAVSGMMYAGALTAFMISLVTVPVFLVFFLFVAVLASPLLLVYLPTHWIGKLINRTFVRAADTRPEEGPSHETSSAGFIAQELAVVALYPFITASIYLRNARLAGQAASLRMRRARLLLAMLGPVTLIVVPLGIIQAKGIVVARAGIREVLVGTTDASVQAAATRLKRWRLIAKPYSLEIARAYEKETDKARRERLARAYFELVGLDIERALRRLKD